MGETQPGGKYEVDGVVVDANGKPLDADYDSMSVEELKAEAARRGIEVAGTGAGGNIVKADLVAALSG